MQKVWLYTAPMDADPFSAKAIRAANPAFDEFMNKAEVLQQAADAIDEGGTTDGAVMLEGLEALATRAGALADLVCYVVAGDLGKMDADEWVHSPRTLAALRTLERGGAAAA